MRNIGIVAQLHLGIATMSAQLQIIRLNTLVDIIIVAKARTSCEYLPIDTNFVSILLLVSVLFRGLFSPHSKAKANYKSTNLRKIGN